MEDIIAPALENLVLYNDSKELGYYIDFLETWSAPALSNLVTVHVSPSPLSPILALTSLDLMLSLRTTYPSYLFDILNKMHGLTDLSIFFDDHRGLRTPLERSIVLQCSQLHSVLRLRITCTIVLGIGSYYSTQLESSIFRQLCFPNAHDLNVTFIGEFDDGDSPEPRFDLSEVAGRVFHREDYDDKGKLKPRQFPRVSCLQININVANENQVWEKYFPRGVAVLPIPLQIFPSLKELRVHCSTFLDLSTHYLGRPDQPALRRVELNTPKLESSFRDSGPPLVYWRWIRALAIALTAQCVWGEIEQLTLIERVFETYSDGTGFRKRDVKMELSRNMIFVGVDLDNLYIGDESNN
ncbi:hypothetical protein SCHPADRAFT_482376 [Schizopora paradoxa]|uniref:F-box domain-containing protein n=1 Tax=Schizopora paradoxa TaxID=27342 RepID=A0A0H2RNZ7_9AGAM|nr:hypothetical protein SCHPADRAFT_482376 [Schizopora paradoxa]